MGIRRLRVGTVSANQLLLAVGMGLVLAAGWTGVATAVPLPLTLSGPINGNIVGPQSSSNPCIIAGTTCQQPSGFGYNNFKSDGNTSSYDMYSTTPTAEVADGVQGTPYTVSQLTGLGSSSFVVAIDVNTTGAASETLTLFQVIVNGTVLYEWSGSANIGNVNNNGNGWADYTLGIVDLSGLNANDEVLFHATWSNAVDGAESFFLVPQAEPVPEPSSLLLLGSGLLGAGAAIRRRLGNRRVQTVASAL